MPPRQAYTVSVHEDALALVEEVVPYVEYKLSKMEPAQALDAIKVFQKTFKKMSDVMRQKDGDSDDSDEDEMSLVTVQNKPAKLEFNWRYDDDAAVQQSVVAVARHFYDELLAQEFTINNAMQRIPKDNAVAITTFIFDNCLGTLGRRICDIVEGAKGYNHVVAASNIAMDDTAPDLIRDLALSIRELKLNEHTMSRSYQYVARLYNLANFFRTWTTLQRIAKENTPEGKALNRYIDRQREKKSARGVGKTSVLKDTLIKKLDLNANEWDKMVRDAKAPAAVSAHFGDGGLLLLPNATGAYSQGFKYLSAVDEIFGVLKQIDEPLSALQNMCDLLNDLFVRPMMSTRSISARLTAKITPTMAIMPMLTQLAEEDREAMELA